MPQTTIYSTLTQKHLRSPILGPKRGGAAALLVLRSWMVGPAPVHIDHEATRHASVNKVGTSARCGRLLGRCTRRIPRDLNMQYTTRTIDSDTAHQSETSGNPPLPGDAPGTNRPHIWAIAPRGDRRSSCWPEESNRALAGQIYPGNRAKSSCREKPNLAGDKP